MIDREKIIDELFAQAVDLVPAEREKFFAERTANDGLLSSEGVLDEVKALLDDYNRAEAESFLQQPLIATDEDEPPHALLIGQQLKGYKILGLIDEGGMGEVYLAEDTELGRQVAIKLIKSHLKTKELLRRFLNERHILANLQHPNIARLLEAGTTADHLPFFVMEYVEGQPVDKYADDHKLSITERLKLFRAVCSAVSYAHQNLIIHRDIKPSNILVTGDGEPKLLDFGIAKLLQSSDSQKPNATATMFQVMTPEYASPEQVKGEPITTATDVYSLGVLLYELLTGRHPHKLKRRSPREVSRAVCEQEPERPSAAISRVEESSERTGPITAERVSKTREGEPEHLIRRLRGDLDNIILKAIHKEPQRRYSSVGEFSEDIRRHLEGLPVIARKDTLKYRTSKFIRRNKFGVAAAAVILLILMGGIVATAWEAHVARAERARAERRFNEVRKMANSFMFEFHDAIQDLPGSLKARQLVVQKALGYLDSLAQEAGDDRELQSELAVAYDKIGSLTFDVAKSFEIHRKALSLNEALVKAEPGNAKYREQLAVSYSYVADLSKESGDSSGALDNNEKARVIMEPLVASDPANIQYRSRLAENYEEMGKALTELGQAAKAVEYSRKALVIRQALVTAEPTNAEYRFYLVVDYILVGGPLLDIGDNAGALENYRKALAVSESLLASDPTSARYRRHMWASYSRVANALMRIGDLAGALDDYRKALTFIAGLAAADPGDKGHAHAISITYLDIGNVLAEMGKTSAALEIYRKALAISENLLASDPSKTETRIDLAKIYTSLGSLLTSLDDTAKALDYLHKGKEFFAEAAKSDPKSITPKKGLADTYSSIGELHERIASHARSLSTSQTEHWQEARTWFQKSLYIWQDIRNNGTLSVADSNRSEEVAREVAQLEQLLKQ